DDGEHGHRFGEAVDRGAPILPGEQQHRGNQRAGVGDTDPPDGVDDGKAPGNGDVEPEDPDPGSEQILQRVDEQYGERGAQCERDPPRPGRANLEDDPGKAVSYRG